MSWVFLSKFYCQTFWGYFSHQRIPFPVCNDSCAYALGCGDDHFRQMFSHLQNFANTHNITSHKNKNVFLGKHEKRFIWPLRHLWNDPLSQNNVTLIIWNGLPTVSQSSELQDIWLILSVHLSKVLWWCASFIVGYMAASPFQWFIDYKWCMSNLLINFQWG